MCILEPPTAISATPDLLSDHSASTHFESLLVCATIISLMAHNVIHTESNASDRTDSRRCSQSVTRAVRQVCPLSTFILGGPMPPSPGLIPLCWEDLIDWTDDATEISEKVHRRSQDADFQNHLLPAADPSLDAARASIRFVPYVSVHETNAVKKLASQSYMERAQFYQQSVIVAIHSKDEGGALCLISLFQFCRYLTLIRRLADYQALVLEYQPSATTSASGGPSSSFRVNGGAVFDDNGDTEPLRLENAARSLDGQLQDCVICLEKAEDSVLFCCSQAICADCEKRWVRRRLCCPFCRKSFASVREVVQTQWQLSSAIPVEQVVQDIQCLGEKVRDFWERLDIDQISENDRLALSRILEEDYVRRPRTLGSRGVEDGDGFIVLDG